ncbi:hypothetical protein D9C73_000902 [Collichthys lucidus]|uniref:Uncharacterized protein n=1 Tax=Collichthys lucidus TaxID=240159 RepID=A0A4U5U150_COLLU|nr:hypothetical protein D9C73_000902 [Collichthys lucidus]
MNENASQSFDQIPLFVTTPLIAPIVFSKSISGFLFISKCGFGRKGLCPGAVRDNQLGVFTLGNEQKTLARQDGQITRRLKLQPESALIVSRDGVFVASAIAARDPPLWENRKEHAQAHAYAFCLAEKAPHPFFSPWVVGLSQALWPFRLHGYHNCSCSEDMLLPSGPRPPALELRSLSQAEPGFTETLESYDTMSHTDNKPEEEIGIELLLKGC